MNEKEKLLNKLRVKIFFHRKLYYTYDESILLDWEYDELERQIIKLEDEMPNFRPLESIKLYLGNEIPSGIRDLIFRLLETHQKESIKC